MPSHELTFDNRDLRIELLPSAGDPDWGSEAYQTAVAQVQEALICLNPHISCEMLVMESADSISLLFGVFHAALSRLAPGAGKVFESWFAAKTGRKVRLKVGDIEVEAHSVAEVERLLERAQEIKAAEDRRKLSL